MNSPSAARTGYAPVHGLQIYHEIHGEAKLGRPPVVLLRGGGDTIETSLGRILPALARDRMVVAFEHHGNGRTAASLPKSGKARSSSPARQLLGRHEKLLVWTALIACQVIGPDTARAGSTFPVEVTIGGEAASIGNPSLAWEMSLVDGRLRTTAVTNRRTGARMEPAGEDFIVELADGQRIKGSAFKFERAADEPVAGGGRRLVIELSHGPLDVRLVTQVKPDEWWASRWLEISANTGGLAAVTFSSWRCAGARGPDPAMIAGGPWQDSLGLANGFGQPVYWGDLFLAVAHPGAQNLAEVDGVSFRLPCYETLAPGKSVRTREFVVGAGEAGDGRRAFLNYLDATRAVPARMIFLVNDWYWKDKSRRIEGIQALAGVKARTGVPIDSFTLDDGWDVGGDPVAGLWGSLGRAQFPGGWEALQAAGRPANIAISLWFGPIGGYSERAARIESARALNFETNGDKFCLAGPRYQSAVVKAFSHWARLGMDYIKVDGFWPDCPQTDHGHLTGERGTIEQMDALMRVFAAWREARRNLVIAFTSGSNPSPFWLQHCDFLWRGGVDDDFSGLGETFDRYSTFIDSCLQRQRPTELAPSALATFDIVQDRIVGCSDAAFERNAWWLAARTSLHHDWYVQAGDFTDERWRLLARVGAWAKKHEQVFHLSHMVGGDPSKRELYGFSAFDGRDGTLALRNPSIETRTLTATLADLLDLSTADRARGLRLRGVYGRTQGREGVFDVNAPWRIELPPLGVAVFEVKPAAPGEDVGAKTPTQAQHRVGPTSRLAAAVECRLQAGP